jgi:predicted DNA-binding transcriptional regulator YafY
MPKTKNANVRHNVIDRCLRDVDRSYTLEDLTREVADYLIEELGHDRGVSKSTIEKDINYMRSRAGYMAPIDVEKTPQGWFYYYTDRKFSISKSPLDLADSKKLRSVLKILEQFRHLPQFQDLEEIMIKLESRNLKAAGKPARQTIVFENNPLAGGMHFIRLLHKHIVDRHVLDISYRPFDKETSVHRVSPLILKEYSNRWFMIGISHHKNAIINLALDRMVNVEMAIDDYRDVPDFDHDEYYRNVIGVTVIPTNKGPERILLRFKPEQGNYIRTKPLHASQNILKDNNKEFLVEYRLTPNYELKRLIWSFGDNVQVIEPEDLLTRAIK